MAEGYAALDSVRLREIRCGGFTVKLQFNPKRIVSSGAKVDAKSIAERKCFLCLENLPEAQKGVLYQGDFLILCNPAPIFSRHYTIANVKHIPQEIEKFAGVFLSLAKDLSPRFTVFYNGPKCGASAPDHMHFQSSPSGVIPVESDAKDSRRRVLRKRTGEVSWYTLREYGRHVIVLESGNARDLEGSLLHVLHVMREFSGVPEEPMVNILCSFEQEQWRIILFPRRKHRPDVYFKEGEGKILISPASVDIGGLVITPIEKDFVGVDAKTIENIFQEVTVENNTINDIIHTL